MANSGVLVVYSGGQDQLQPVIGSDIAMFALFYRDHGYVVKASRFRMSIDGDSHAGCNVTRLVVKKSSRTSIFEFYFPIAHSTSTPLLGH